MITLKELDFINILYNDMMHHISIEIDDDNKFIYTFGRFGDPDDISKISQLIIDVLENNYNTHIIVDYDWLKKINIIRNHTNNKPICSYDFERTSYEDKSIYIDISLNDNIEWQTENYNIIYRLIKHEILHAYEDIHRYIKGTKIFKEIISNKYKSACSTLTMHTNKYAKNVSNIIYLLCKQEINANMSNLKDDIIDIINKHHFNSDNFDFNIMIHDLKNIDIWKKYFELGNFIFNLDKIDMKIVCREYNKHNNSSYDENKVRALIENDFIRFKNKFEQLVPKIIFEYLPITNKTRSIR